MRVSEKCEWYSQSISIYFKLMSLKAVTADEIVYIGLIQDPRKMHFTLPENPVRLHT